MSLVLKVIVLATYIIIVFLNIVCQGIFLESNELQYCFLMVDMINYYSI